MKLDTKTKEIQGQTQATVSMALALHEWEKRKSLLYCVKISNVHTEMQYTRFRKYQNSSPTVHGHENADELFLRSGCKENFSEFRHYQEQFSEI